MKRPLTFLTAAVVIIATAAFTQATTASAFAVIDEGGYYNVHAYGVWQFEHAVHGSHHCCGVSDATFTADNLVATLGSGAANAEDVDEYITDGSNSHAPDPYSSQQYGYYPSYNPWTGWTVQQCSPYYSGSQYGLIC